MSVGNRQFDAAAIEAIVREVLRRVQELRQRPSVGTPTPTARTAPAPIQSNFPRPINGTCSAPTNTHIPASNLAPCTTTCTSPPVEAHGHVFECTNKVISTQTLRGKLENVTTIRVRPKTILTPAVRDQLRDRKIRIAFDLGSSVQTNDHSPKTILLGTTCNTTGNSLRDQLVANGTQVQLHVEKSAAQLANNVGKKISASMPALIVADHPYSAACSANRNSSVRAVVIGDPNELRAAKAELNPNCVVIKSGNEGQFNLSYVLNQFS